MSELTSAQSSQGDGVASCEPDSTRKPFVEPVVSVPQDVLEATAFFQGSAAIGAGGGDGGADGLD
jgi:hypothetical protein